VSAEEIIDASEIKVFDSYAWRNRHMLAHSGIPSYENCWRPLTQYYYEGTLSKDTSSA